jgi:membrane protein required for colicin V production
MKFNVLDAMLLALLFLAAYLGYRGGPLKKFITMLATVAAVVIGVRLMHPLGRLLSAILPSAFSYAAVFVIVVVGLLVALYILYRRFGKKTTAQKPARVFAGALGVMEAAFLLSVLLLLLRVFDLPGTSLRSGSLLYRPLVNFAPLSFDALQTAVPAGGEVRQLSGESPAP